MHHSNFEVIYKVKASKFILILRFDGVLIEPSQLSYECMEDKCNNSFHFLIFRNWTQFVRPLFRTGRVEKLIVCVCVPVCILRKKLLDWKWQDSCYNKAGYQRARGMPISDVRIWIRIWIRFQTQGFLAGLWNRFGFRWIRIHLDSDLRCLDSDSRCLDSHITDANAQSFIHICTGKNIPPPFIIIKVGAPILLSSKSVILLQTPKMEQSCELISITNQSQLYLH